MSTIVLNGYGPGVKLKVSDPKAKATMLVIGSKGVKPVTVSKTTNIKFAA
jgi:hypothetical protein